MSSLETVSAMSPLPVTSVNEASEDVRDDLAPPFSSRPGWSFELDADWRTAVDGAAPLDGKPRVEVEGDGVMTACGTLLTDEVRDTGTAVTPMGSAGGMNARRLP